MGCTIELTQVTGDPGIVSLLRRGVDEKEINPTTLPPAAKGRAYPQVMRGGELALCFVGCNTWERIPPTFPRHHSRANRGWGELASRAWEGKNWSYLLPTKALSVLAWAELGNLSWMVWVQESWRPDQVSYHPGLWVGLQYMNPIYELLEHVKGLVFSYNASIYLWLRLSKRIPVRIHCW